MLAGTEKAGNAARKLVSSFASMATNAAFKSLFGSLVGSTGDGAGGVASGLLGSLDGLFGGGTPGGWRGSGGVRRGQCPTRHGLLQPPAHVRLCARGASWDRADLYPFASMPGAVSPPPRNWRCMVRASHRQRRSCPCPMAAASPSRCVSVAAGVSSTMSSNVTVNTGGGGGNGQGGQGGNLNEVGDAVAAALHQKIVEVMIDQSRLGGSLNPAM